MLVFALQHTDDIAAFVWGREWVAIVLISAVGGGVYGVLALLLGAARPSDYKSPHPPGVTILQVGRVSVRKDQIHERLSGATARIIWHSAIGRDASWQLYWGRSGSLLTSSMSMSAIFVWWICMRLLSGKTLRVCANRSFISQHPIWLQVLTLKRRSSSTSRGVRAHAELAWILNCVARLGWARSHDPVQR